MKSFYCIIALLVFLVFEGCSNSEYVSIPHEESGALDSLDLKDFALLRANGKIVILGTDESSASIKDGPAMKVSFDSYGGVNSKVAYLKPAYSNLLNMPASNTSSETPSGGQNSSGNSESHNGLAGGDESGGEGGKN